MATSDIEWTELTWNPTTGCDKISPGCKNCYAEVMSKRLKAMGQEKYADGFVLREHPSALAIPKSWKKPAMVFVNSMSDLFHAEVSPGFIEQVFEVMNAHPHLTFQVLTKRARIAAELSPRLNWTPNIWMGVSVENQDAADERIPYLRKIPARVRFLSCEPLLGPVDLERPLPGPDLDQGGGDKICQPWMIQGGIHWVIAGGESGPKARPMHPDWARSLRDQCAAAGVPFFFKQWGEWLPAEEHYTGPDWKFQDGRVMDSHEFPEDLTTGDGPAGWTYDLETATVFRKVGKAAAGRLLDGVEHSAFPS